MVTRNFGRVIGGKDFLKPRKWETWAVGDFVQGEFVGELDKDRYGKPIYGIKVDGVKDGEVRFQDASSPSGKKDGVVPLYPNGGLLMQLGKASHGDFVRITYEGKVKIKKGQWAGSTAHSVVVEIDGYKPEGAEVEGSVDDLLGE
jgi:hypothetical protein